MRSFLGALLLTSLFSMTIAPALADPAGDINQAVKAFAAVKSVHIDVTGGNGMTGSEDMVAPNKSHITYNMMGRQMQMIRIGQDVWVNAMGSWSKGTHYMSTNPIVTQMDAAQAILNKNKDVREKYKVTDAGSGMVNGTTAHKYHMVDKGNGSQIDVYLAPNHLPLQIVFGKGDQGMTWTYSQYNSVSDIAPPM